MREKENEKEKEKLDSRSLAALLSPLLSQLILLFPLLSPPLPPLTLPPPSPNSSPFPLLHHFLSASEIAAAISLLSYSRKRKRTHYQDTDAPENDTDDDPRLGQLGQLGQLERVDSVIPRSPDSFKSFFMMNSSTFEWLCGLVEPLLDCRDPVDSPLNLPAESRLGIGLFRLATGADHREIASRFRVSELVAKFCVKQLCRVLCTNYRFWVGFPSQNELDSVSTQFETLTGMPNCCGIIGCIRFKTKRNNGCDSILGNKPQEDSIAAQIVVDSSSRILSIAAGFHGEKDDSKVLKSSTLYKDIEQGALLKSQPIYVNGVAVPQHLVGDESYPLLPWLLVPFDNPIAGSCEENFNKAYSIMNLRMRKTISSLRNWGILRSPIEAEFRGAVGYIGSCSILHNMMLAREDYSAFSDDFDDYSLLDHSFQYYKDNGNEENTVVEKKAYDIRSSLATKAKTSR